MKDKNLQNDYNSQSLEELTKRINTIIEELENQKDLEKSIENYQNLLTLNNIIEKKFQMNAKNISKKTREKISIITSNRYAKKIK